MQLFNYRTAQYEACPLMLTADALEDYLPRVLVARNLYVLYIHKGLPPLLAAIKTLEGFQGLDRQEDT